MSEQLTPVTYEGILEMFRQSALEFDRRLQEADRRWQKMNQELWTQIRQTNKDVAGLTGSIAAIVENMIKGNIIEKFEALGYGDLDRCSEKQTFRNKKLGIKGEIDLFIENGDIAILRR
ncbi:MAG: hypothetical protein FWC43_11890 [Planctomycetaceae bacterium]|nr:hypothetical protein [Planctomycetaceae bacterium]